MRSGFWFKKLFFDFSVNVQVLGRKSGSVKMKGVINSNHFVTFRFFIND